MEEVSEKIPRRAVANQLQRAYTGAATMRNFNETKLRFVGCNLSVRTLDVCNLKKILGEKCPVPGKREKGRNQLLTVAD